MEVRRYLDLSTAHLPDNVMNAPLASLPGVIAYPYKEGAWLHVPDDDSGRLRVPSEVVALWRYARKHGCDFVRLDADGFVNEDLPTWEW